MSKFPRQFSIRMLQYKIEVCDRLLSEGKDLQKPNCRYYLSEMNYTGSSDSDPAHIQKKRGCFTQQNDRDSLDSSFTNFSGIEGFQKDRRSSMKSSKDVSLSQCTFDGDTHSKISVESVDLTGETQCRKRVRFVSGTEFYERNPNSKFWKDIEKRRRCNNMRHIDSVTYFRRRRPLPSFKITGSQLRTPENGVGEGYNERQNPQVTQNQKAVPPVVIQREYSGSNNVCCLETLGRRFRDLVCCNKTQNDDDAMDDCTYPPGTNNRISDSEEDDSHFRCV